jgi:AraC-like DNA-binding protein
MAFIRKTKQMIRLERAHHAQDIRQLLLDAYARHNTLQAVAKEFGVSQATMSIWFRQLGLHTRASLPANSIPQDLSATDETRYDTLSLSELLLLRDAAAPPNQTKGGRS